MKYLDFPELNRVSQALCHEGECSVRTRIEAYSCKPISRDKRLLRELESAWTDELAHSPPLPSFVEPEAERATPFGPIDARGSRRTLYTLIQTLNVAFPDHEFSDVRPTQFSREPSAVSVLGALSASLCATRTYGALPSSSDLFPRAAPTSSSPPEWAKPSPRAPPPVVGATHPTLFRILDDVISLQECEVYSYEPDIASDPHANDDDEECDAASVGDEDSDTDDEEPTGFAFDAEFDGFSDAEEMPKSPKSKSSRKRRPAPAKSGSTSSDSSSRSSRGRLGSVRIPIGASAPAYTRAPLDSSPSSYQPHVRMKRRGALLWSSHWFFLNRKLKRIVYITVWSRTRGARVWVDSDESDGIASSPERLASERFTGWAGSVGAGARAMGLQTWN